MLTIRAAAYYYFHYRVIWRLFTRLININCQKKVIHVHHNIPEPKLTYYLFKLTNSLKPKDIEITNK